MLICKALCGSWQRHIINPPANVAHNATSYILHHVRQPLAMRKSPHQYRSIRSSRFNYGNGSSKGVSIQGTPFSNIIPGDPVPSQQIVKAIVFTGAFSVGTFLGATIMEYENTRHSMIERARQTQFSFLRRKSTVNVDSFSWQNLKSIVERHWNQLTPGEKVFVPLCALNVLVFGLWRVPSLRGTMMSYFCSNPAGRAVCWPMFLSTFSHYSAFHLFANMYVLHSFTNATVMALGKEQFLFLYLTGGVLASLSSILYRAATSQVGFSLGASGAIMAILAFVCTQYPSTQLNIFFLPMFTFSAGSAIKVIMGMDLAGCIMGWKFFDHAAHLGGALFGVFWAYYGLEVWRQRLPFLSMYHDWRKTKSN